jgi:hypothetical protein
LARSFFSHLCLFGCHLLAVFHLSIVGMSNLSEEPVPDQPKVVEFQPVVFRPGDPVDWEKWMSTRPDLQALAAFVGDSFPTLSQPHVTEKEKEQQRLATQNDRLRRARLAILSGDIASADMQVKHFLQCCDDTVGGTNSSLKSAIYQFNRDSTRRKVYSLERLARHQSWLELAAAEFLDCPDASLLVDYHDELKSFLASMMEDARQHNVEMKAQAPVDAPILTPPKRLRTDEQELAEMSV